MLFVVVSFLLNLCSLLFLFLFLFFVVVVVVVVVVVFVVLVLVGCFGLLFFVVG